MFNAILLFGLLSMKKSFNPLQVSLIGLYELFRLFWNNRQIPS